MGDAPDIQRAIREIDSALLLAAAASDDDPAWPDGDVAPTPQQRVGSITALLQGVRRNYEDQVRPAALAHAVMVEGADFDVERSILGLDGDIRRLVEVTSPERDARNPAAEYTRLDLMTVDPAELSEPEWRKLVADLVFHLFFLWTWGR